jgi:hypothetical protein
VADPTLLEGVTARTVNTPRLRTRLLSGGAVGGAPVFFVHGNVSSSRFFEETLAALPPDAGYWGLARAARYSSFTPLCTRPSSKRSAGDWCPKT